MIAASLKALLSGVIDYAGQFPPAKLPMAEAWHNYQRYQTSLDRWMLGNFVCPAAKLVEMGSLATEAASVRLSILGRGGATGREFLTNLKQDLSDVISCYTKSGGKLQAPIFETKLPDEVVTNDHYLRDLLAEVAEATVVTKMSLFFEAPTEDIETLERLLTALQETPFANPVGYKLRTGGLEPSAFLSCSRVALILATCLHVGVALKATAGLHHPLPRFDAGVRARMHGFINLLTAGILGKALRLPAVIMQEILEEEKPTRFSFTEDRLSWGDRSASIDQISRARQTAVLSLGSCSFDEPRQDLRALGWLPPEAPA